MVRGRSVWWKLQLTNSCDGGHKSGSKYPDRIPTVKRFVAYRCAAVRHTVCTSYMHILSVVLMLGDLHRELYMYSMEEELRRGGLIFNAAPVVTANVQTVWRTDTAVVVWVKDQHIKATTAVLPRQNTHASCWSWTALLFMHVLNPHLTALSPVLSCGSGSLERADS